MGYTHYWYQPVGKPIPPSIWARIVKDVRKVLKVCKTPLLAEYDEPGTKPQITKDVIRFNGVDQDGHETFFFERSPEQATHRAGEPEVFNFCKTARKPYDAAVCACLIVINEHAGDLVRVSSDGDAPEWLPGLELACNATGAELSIPFDVTAPA